MAAAKPSIISCDGSGCTTAAAGTRSDSSGETISIAISDVRGEEWGAAWWCRGRIEAEARASVGTRGARGTAGPGEACGADFGSGCAGGGFALRDGRLFGVVRDPRRRPTRAFFWVTSANAAGFMPGGFPPPPLDHSIRALEGNHAF